MVAIGYVRRSKESGERTVSLEAQTEHVREYAERQGWTLVSVLTDDGISGGKRERFERIKAAVKAHHAKRVVTYHLDRFARDVAGMLDTLQAFTRRGVELHVVGVGKIEAKTANGYLNAAIHGVFAEHYRRVIAEKTADALERLRVTHCRYSRIPPYGFRLCPEGRRLIPDPQEQAHLTVIQELAPGRSLRVLSHALADRGILARNGKPFVPKVLRDLVTNRSVGNRQTKVS